MIRTGVCSGAAHWKLKLSPDNGRIELEFQVDTNRVGRAWRVRIRHNGVLIFVGERVTKAPSGAFTVRLLTNNRAGTDSFRAGARAVVSGQTCVGGVRRSADGVRPGASVTTTFTFAKGGSSHGALRGTGVCGARRFRNVPRQSCDRKSVWPPRRKPSIPRSLPLCAPRRRSGLHPSHAEGPRSDRVSVPAQPRPHRTLRE